MTDVSSQNTDDKVIGFFRDLAQQKQSPAAPRPVYARWSGMVLGALLGLTYGLSTQSINSIVLPTVPFAHYPFGFAGNCLAALVGGTFIGLLCAWPTGGINGAVLGSLGVVVCLELRAWVIQAVPFSLLVQSSALAPFVLLAAALAWAVVLPLMLLLRWAIDVQSEAAHQPIWSGQRLKLPLIALVLAGCAGALVLYPAEVRQAMNSMNVLIQKGLKASTAENLPSALRSEQVNDFLLYASSEYTLEESNDVHLRQDIVALADAEDVVIVARFRSGWTLVCVFEQGSYEPSCKSYEPRVAPGINDRRALEFGTRAAA